MLKLFSLIYNFFFISERVVVDVFYIDEIDGFFKEVNIIENFLI